MNRTLAEQQVRFADRLFKSDPPPWGGEFYKQSDAETLVRLAYRAGHAAGRRDEKREQTECRADLSGIALRFLAKIRREGESNADAARRFSEWDGKQVKL